MSPELALILGVCLTVVLGTGARPRRVRHQARATYVWAALFLVVPPLLGLGVTRLFRGDALLASDAQMAAAAFLTGTMAPWGAGLVILLAFWATRLIQARRIKEPAPVAPEEGEPPAEDASIAPAPRTPGDVGDVDAPDHLTADHLEPGQDGSRPVIRATPTVWRNVTSTGPENGGGGWVTGPGAG